MTLSSMITASEPARKVAPVEIPTAVGSSPTDQRLLVRGKGQKRMSHQIPSANGAPFGRHMKRISGAKTLSDIP